MLSDELKILMYFVGVTMIAISVAVLSSIPACGFIIAGSGLIIYPIYEMMFIN